MSLILGTIAAVAAVRGAANGAVRKFGSAEIYLLGTDVLSSDLSGKVTLGPMAKSFTTSVVAGLTVALLVG